MKIGFKVEKCAHVLFQCPEYVNEMPKNHTKAVSGEFCVISLFYLCSTLRNGKISVHRIHLLPKNRPTPGSIKLQQYHVTTEFH